jgi:NAD(P)H-hydrate repair Nnr-like enzyme with NAD(P)H-hydrate epimerase domain
VPSPIYLTEEIRRIEQQAAGATPPLMERAGTAAAALAARLVSDERKDVLVLAGPGNNGGDARILAERLREQFFRITLVTRPDELPSTARWSLVVDGLFGIGLTRPIEGDYARLVDYVNRQTCPVLGLDVPCGLVSDPGRVRG